MSTAEPCAQLRLKNQLCYPIYLCSKEIIQSYTPLLDKLNLTYTQYIVMLYFWEMGESSQKQLSKTLLLDPSTLTPLLKKLEAKGYITRKRSETDERSLVLALTEQGERLKDAALSIPGEIGACMGLGEQEAKTLYALAYKVLMNITKEKENAVH